MFTDVTSRRRVCKTNGTKRVKIQRTCSTVLLCSNCAGERNDERARVTEWFSHDERSSRTDDSITQYGHIISVSEACEYTSNRVRQFDLGIIRNRMRIVTNKPIGKDVQTIRVLCAYYCARQYRRKVSVKFVHSKQGGGEIRLTRTRLMLFDEFFRDKRVETVFIEIVLFTVSLFRFIMEKNRLGNKQKAYINHPTSLDLH